MIARSPFAPEQAYAHLRAADLQADIAAAARVYVRRLTPAELSEVSAAVVRILVDTGRSDLWLTDEQFIELCTTHTHSAPLERT